MDRKPSYSRIDRERLMRTIHQLNRTQLGNRHANESGSSTWNQEAMDRFQHAAGAIVTTVSTIPLQLTHDRLPSVATTLVSHLN